jgi:type IV pilus assembly protein PilV
MDYLMLAPILAALKRYILALKCTISDDKRQVSHAMCCHRKKNESGYILLEALIVSGLIALGILTMAGLQKTGLRLSYSSFLRSKSTILAYEMADRVRVNLPGQVVGAYDALTGTPSNPGCITTGCTPVQVAQNDYYEWNNELASALPSGVGVVCLTSTPAIGTPDSPGCDGNGSQYAAKIWWVQKDEKNSTVQSQAFFYVVFKP